MDFATYDPSIEADEGADMEVCHPVTGETFMDGDKPVTIRVRGFESDTAKNVARLQSQKAMKSRNVDQEKNGLDLLAAVTVSWSGVSWDGKPLECNKQNAIMLYKNRDFIARQVLEFAGNNANFFTETSSD